MALNKRFKDIGKLYDKLGYNNADCLFQAMGKSADYYYVGFLTQIGTDVPTKRTLYNDFLPENAFTLTYEGTGKYRMYCNLFKPGYVEVEVNEGQNNAPTSSVVLATVYDGYVEFTTLDGGSAMDDILYNTPVKIKVWTNAGVTVAPLPDCFFYYSPNVDVQGWFIDGIDSNDVGYLNGILNPYGYLYNIFALGDGTYRFILSYIGTTPPTYLPVILDSGSNPVTWTLTNCCNKVCLEGTFNAADAVYLQTGYGWNWLNGAAIFGHSSVEEAIKSLYGTQTIYTATDNGDGTWYIKIDNAYVCNPPLAWSANDATYNDMVPCGTPPVPSGFRYFMANDASCSVFTANTVEWAIDNAGLGGSVPFSSSWDAMMAAFYPVGGGAMIENFNLSNCNGMPNSYVLRTIGNVDPGMISVYDGSNNLVQSGSFNLITSMKCFVGLYDSNYPPATQTLRTLDFIGGEYSIGSVYGLDASDPLAFMGYLETGILQLINNPAVTATATNLGGTLWELRISNMYTNATSVDIKLFSTGIPVATLVETTC